ncbi:DNA-binding transcriptional MerR regulator [Actinocorallia herbida]|uniref:DNA-binding transcriptional MerR regulator n=1 Tax=Actinocorallia herbida TaxID=58109 RepID=A0A3N1D6H6_9ACTN|nr:GyrI-like domain-containing protein [Actinocorallia herbida]ROO89137.1 DNA-binding transcriptional MerR regulator [Actinocorallia herbida]
MPEDLLTIGRFALLCRLSVKRLRHYADLGLLPPDRVDAATGYRYYASDRVPDALTIALLRDLDVPLPAIAAVLAAAGDERARLLGAARDRVAARIERDRARLAVLDRLAEGRTPAYEVALADVPALRLTAVRARYSAADLGKGVGECVAALFAALAGGPWTAPLHGVFPLDLAEPAAVAVGVRADRDPPGTVPLALPAATVVRTLHRGPYTEIPLAYHALLAWAGERGLAAHGHAREEYLVGPDEAEPADLLTRVALPVGPRPKTPADEITTDLEKR